MLGCPWLTAAGLLIDAMGVLVIGLGAIVSKQEAIRLGVGQWAYESDEDNLKLRTVQHILSESRRTVAGLLFIFVGLVLQVLGSWPT